MIKKLFIIFNLIFCITKSFALQKMYIFHINGINTSQDQALANTQELNKAANLQSNVIANNGQVDLLYNKEGNSTCTLCTQLSDVFSQKRFENVNIDDYVQVYSAARGLKLKPETPEYEDLKKSIYSKFLEDSAFMGNNFGDILEQYHGKTVNTKYLNEYIASNNGGKPFVLLVPHSQGNLYANSLYQHLTTKEGFNQQNLSIFGIASPAAQNLGAYISKTAYNSDGYITSSNDGVINSLRVLAAVSPMSIAGANFTIPKGGEFSGHGLIPTYLTNDGSRKIISEGMYNIIHYFWLSNIYSNFQQTLNGGNRALSDGLSLVTMQNSNSTLSVAGIMAKGKCLGNTPYFVTKHAKFDHEMSTGTQCVSNAKGTINLNAQDFANSNTLKIKLSHGEISQKKIECRLLAYFVCQNEMSFANIQNHYYNGIIGGIDADTSCEKKIANAARGIYTDWWRVKVNFIQEAFENGRKYSITKNALINSNVGHIKIN